MKHVVNGDQQNGWYCYSCDFASRDVAEAAAHDGTKTAEQPPVSASPAKPQWFQKNPVKVRALQWTGNNEFEMGHFMPGKFTISDSGARLFIATLEGTMEAQVLDWIICGVKGEFYPCKPDIFEATYSPAASPVAVDSAPRLLEAWQFLQNQIASVLRGHPVHNFDETISQMDVAIRAVAVDCSQQLAAAQQKIEWWKTHAVVVIDKEGELRCQLRGESTCWALGANIKRLKEELKNKTVDCSGGPRCPECGSDKVALDTIGFSIWCNCIDCKTGFGLRQLADFAQFFRPVAAPEPLPCRTPGAVYHFKLAHQIESNREIMTLHVYLPQEVKIIENQAEEIEIKLHDNY